MVKLVIEVEAELTKGDINQLIQETMDRVSETLRVGEADSAAKSVVITWEKIDEDFKNPLEIGGDANV